VLRPRTLTPVIDHMQLADVPGRHEPGTGEIGWEYVSRRIDELGYTGWIGCEYNPVSDTVAGLPGGRANLRQRRRSATVCSIGAA
jgi:hydroxypyruvate isomerase